jgi:hypothetical protein
MFKTCDESEGLLEANTFIAIFSNFYVVKHTTLRKLAVPQ